jgi:hypothetical protein
MPLRCQPTGLRATHGDRLRTVGSSPINAPTLAGALLGLGRLAGSPSPGRKAEYKHRFSSSKPHQTLPLSRITPSALHFATSLIPRHQHSTSIPLFSSPSRPPVFPFTYTQTPSTMTTEVSISAADVRPHQNTKPTCSRHDPSVVAMTQPCLSTHSHPRQRPGFSCSPWLLSRLAFVHFPVLLRSTLHSKRNKTECADFWLSATRLPSVKGLSCPPNWTLKPHSPRARATMERTLDKADQTRSLQQDLPGSPLRAGRALR